MKQRRFGKKIAMWLLAMVMVLGIMNLPGLATTAYAAEYAGSGTQDDPYVVTTYDQLRDAMMNHTGTFYVKLGADIITIDDKNNYHIVVGDGTKKTCMLDLAGYSVYREATTVDTYLIGIGSNATLNIYDSVGNGSISAKLFCGNQGSELLYGNYGGKLIIQDGRFELLSTSRPTFETGSCICTMGADVVIFGGTFKADVNALKHQSGDIVINGGFFETSTVTERLGGPLSLYSEGGSITINKFSSRSNNNTGIHIAGRAADSHLLDYMPENYTLTVEGENQTIASDDCLIEGSSIVFDSNYFGISDLYCAVTIDESKFISGQPIDFSGCDYISAKHLTILNKNNQCYMQKYSADGKLIKDLSSGDIFEAGYRYGIFVCVQVPSSVPKTDAWGLAGKYAAEVNGKRIFASNVYTEDGEADILWISDVIMPQPENKELYVDVEETFSAEMQGATSYRWDVIDDKYNYYKWSEVEQHATVSGRETNTLTITPKDLWLNNKRLICYIVKGDFSDETKPITLSVDINPVQSGKAGDNATWTLNTKTGELKITGKGTLYDNSSDEHWNNLTDFGKLIKTVVIDEGITGGANGTFSYLSSVQSIKLPSTYTSIAGAEFMFCTNLEEIWIPAGLKSIEGGSFYKDKNMKTIYYNGHEDMWNLIEMDRTDKYNAEFLNAEVVIQAKDHVFENGTCKICGYQEGVKTPIITQSGSKVTVSAPAKNTSVRYQVCASDGTVLYTRVIKADASKAGSETFVMTSGKVLATATIDGKTGKEISFTVKSSVSGTLACPSYQVKGTFGGRIVTFNGPAGSEVYYSTKSTMTGFDKHVKAGDQVLFENFYGTIYSRTYQDGKWSNTARLILRIPVCNTPTITDNGGGYYTLKTTTPDCYLYYTTDGSEPSMTNGTKYNKSSVKVKLGDVKTIKVIAVRSCFTNSAVATYTK